MKFLRFVLALSAGTLGAQAADPAPAQPPQIDGERLNKILQQAEAAKKAGAKGPMVIDGVHVIQPGEKVDGVQIFNGNEPMRNLPPEVLAAIQKSRKDAGLPGMAEFHNHGTVGEFVDPVLEEVERFKGQIAALQGDRKFAELDALAQQALEGKQRFANGGWKLFAFYSEVGYCHRENPKMAENQRKFLEDWVAARPQSLTARIAQAEFYTDYAWMARGGGWANQVTEEGWKLFGERLTKAANILKDARSLGVKDPHYWRVYQTIALGIGESKPLMEEIYKQGIALEPQYWSLYLGRATSLLPRWYGEPGELEAFAEAATKVPGGLGPEAYARIVMEMDSYYRLLFSETKLQWPKAKEGFEAMLKNYPQAEPWVLSFYAQLANRSGDTPTKLALLEKLGNRLDKRVWETQERYDKILNAGGSGVIISKPK